MLGDLVGRYRITSDLGRGGMGQVFAALDERLQRRVAVKVLPEEFSSDPDRLRRFEKEARSASALNHPNIITIYDVGVHGVAPYIVMELVDGKRLRDLVRDGPVPPARVIDIGAQIAAGLAKAHEAGIVHRDLKPENLMVSTDGFVKILDFGLVKLTSGARAVAADASTMTATELGVIVGTPAYMSPEQASAGAVDFRSDQFALGAILHEMIAGTSPFRRDTVAATMAAIIEAAPEPLPSSTPPGLARVVNRCLHKDPGQRYSSTRELADDLQRLRETPPRKSAGFWLAAAAALSMAMFGGWWASSRRSAPPRDDRRLVAMRPFKTISADPSQEYVTYGITQDIRDQVSKIGALRLLSAGAVSRYADGENKRLAAETGADRILEGSVRLDQGQIRVDVELIDARTEAALWREHFDRKLADIMTVQSEIATRIADALDARRTTGEQSRMEKRPTDNMAAYDLFLRSRRVGAGPDRRERAERMLTEAIALDPKFSEAMSRLAALKGGRIASGDASKTGEALGWANKALAIDPSSETANGALADIYWYLGRLSSSRAAFQRVLELNPNAIGAMDNGAAVALDLGLFEDALRLSRRALLLSPNVAFVYYHVAGPLLNLDDPAVVERWLEVFRRRFPGDSRLIDNEIQWRLMKNQTGDALAMARKRAGEQPKNGEALAILAEVAFLVSAPDAEALTEPFFRAGPEPRFGNYGLLPQSSRTRYAWLLMKRGAAAQARPLLDQSRKAVEALLADGSDSPLAFEELACIAAILGDTAAAINRYRQAYKAGWRYLLLSRMNPMLESLRREPEFQSLLAQMTADVTRMRVESREVPELLDRTIPFLNTLSTPVPPPRR